MVDEEEGRKVYALTAAGKDELGSRADELRELGDRLTRSARDIAREIRDKGKDSRFKKSERGKFASTGVG